MNNKRNIYTEKRFGEDVKCMTTEDYRYYTKKNIYVSPICVYILQRQCLIEYYKIDIIKLRYMASFIFTEVSRKKKN